MDLREAVVALHTPTVVGVMDALPPNGGEPLSLHNGAMRQAPPPSCSEKRYCVRDSMTTRDRPSLRGNSLWRGAQRRGRNRAASMRRTPPRLMLILYSAFERRRLHGEAEQMKERGSVRRSPRWRGSQTQIKGIRCRSRRRQHQNPRWRGRARKCGGRDSFHAPPPKTNAEPDVARQDVV